VALLFAAGVALRAVLLLAPDIWSDEAANGLMALAVLRGELPVYLYGQAYMGVLDAYLAAPIHQVLGPSVLTLKVLPLALTVVWLGLTVRLAWEVFGPRAAAFAAALLAVPPDFLLQWALETRTKYHLCLVLGTLALLLVRRPLTTARAAILGLVLGLAFWTNFLSVVFYPALAILVLQHGPWPALRATPVGLVAFALGSLPHWIYGIPHATAIPSAGGRMGWAEAVQHARAIVRVAWPILAGVPESIQETPLGLGLAVALAVAVAVAVGAAVRAAWQGPASARGGAVALLALLAINVALAIGTRHGDRIDNDPKYLLPVYTVLPPLVGAGLAALPPAAWAPLLTALLAVQATGAGDGTLQRLLPEARARLTAERQAREATLAAVAASGVDRFYANNASAGILMYLSNERVIVSDPYQEVYPPYARAVDGAPRVGWWLGGQDPRFEAQLAALGVRSMLRPLGDWGAAYTDFARPSARLRELDPATLQATAHPNPEHAAQVLDRDILTYWWTDRPKQGGEWIELDLGRVEPVAFVRWLPRVFQEIPSGVRLDASLDGVTWRRLLELPEYSGPLYWSAGRPMLRVRSGRVELRVEPTPARYLRIAQTGAEARWPWSVTELFVYAADPEQPSVPSDGPAAPLTRAVRAAGVERLYADHGWSSRLALADPGLRVPPANLAVDAYNFVGPPLELFPLVRWEPGSGVLVEPADRPGFERTAEASGLGIARADVDGLTLYTYRSPRPAAGRPVAAADLHITASVASERAAAIADTHPHPRWTTGRDRAVGDWIRVDLATPRRIRGVRLSTTVPAESSQALRLEGSADGTTWAALPASVRAESRVRWAGITWLREYASAVWLEVPPVVARSLRVVLLRAEPERAWSVRDLAVYEAE
jgi:hypothetical protein